MARPVKGVPLVCYLGANLVPWPQLWQIVGMGARLGIVLLIIVALDYLYINLGACLGKPLLV